MNVRTMNAVKMQHVWTKLVSMIAFAITASKAQATLVLVN